MTRTHNALAFAVVLTGGFFFAPPADATMMLDPFLRQTLRACCANSTTGDFCCFEGGAGCRITVGSCTRIA